MVKKRTQQLGTLMKWLHAEVCELERHNAGYIASSQRL